MLSWTPNPYALALIVSALLSGMVAFYAWNSRPRAGASALMFMMLGAAEWSLGYAIAIGIGDLEARIFWAKVQHVGISTVLPGLLIFVLQYTDREALLTRRNLILLMIMPVLDVVLSWTNEAHGLIWREIKLVRIDGMALLDLKYGLFFWLYTFYGYILLVTGAVLLGRAVLFSSGLRRRQAAVLLAGAMMPWLANLLYITKLSPVNYLDLTPFAYSLTGLILTWGLYRYRLLDAVPIAREKVVEHMRDAFIVLNEQHRFVDLNPPAQALLRVVPGQVLGKSALPYFAPWPDLVARFQTEAEGLAEIVLHRDGAPRHYAVQVSQLTNRRQRLIGRLLLLQDVTDRVRAQNAEQAVLQRELHLASNIQTGLLPQSGPRISGLDIAGTSLPTREVGGDLFNYYDLPAASGQAGGCGIAIGDVSGKGVPAALYMAVTTIMLSSKAPFVPDVSQLLGEMNEALHPYMAPNRMNVALCYVRLEREAAGQHCAHIANAGMIAPLLWRAGRCEYLEIGGLPLGLVRHDHGYRALKVGLQAGDVLVLSSDGIVEAMNASRELYGFERLAARVDRRPPGDAQALVGWILDDVKEFIAPAGQRDDMTLVVIEVAADPISAA